MRWLLFLVLAACTTSPIRDGLEDVRVGMDKDEVLHLADNPKHTFHSEGQDHWIYSYYNDDQEYWRELIFESNRVVEIKPAHLRGTPTAEPATPEEELEQYEKSVRDQQQSQKGEFKDVPDQ